MKSKPLYPYQASVSEFVKGKSYAGIFVGYGGGKTFLSLQWLEDLGPEALPCLVVAPTNLAYQWGKQIEQHSNFTYVLVEGSTKDRLRAMPVEADITIIHYDLFRSPKIRELAQMEHKTWISRGKRQHSFKCPGRTRFKSVIVDESTLLKEARTQRFKALYAFCNRLPNRAILTGKPILEQAEDIFAQLHFLDDGKTFGRSFWHFRHQYFSPGPPWDPYAWTLKPGAEAQIAARLSQSCIYIPEEVVNEALPPERHITVHFKMPKSVRKRYDELKSDFSMELLEGGSYETQWAVTRSQKMHQLCQGIVYLTGKGMLLTRRTYDAGGRLLRDYELHHTLKLDWLETQIPLLVRNGPVLIWSDLVRWLPLLQSVIPVASLIYSGADSPADRNKAKEAFQNGEVDVLILSQQAGHKGLDLWRANQAVFVSTGYWADAYANALKRCKRIGSEIHDKITYYHLQVENSLDGVIHEAIKDKLDVADAILKHIRGE